MKIQYASDLHLELSGNSKYVKEIPFEVTGDVLVLAGDTAYLRDKNLQLPQMEFPLHILNCLTVPNASQTRIVSS